MPTKPAPAPVGLSSSQHRRAGTQRQLLSIGLCGLQPPSHAHSPMDSSPPPYYLLVDISCPSSAQGVFSWCEPSGMILPQKGPEHCGAGGGHGFWGAYLSAAAALPTLCQRLCLSSPCECVSAGGGKGPGSPQTSGDQKLMF